MTALLSPRFAARLASLALRSRRRFRAGDVGPRRAKGYGASAEFADHRGYSPGDDLRRLDWNVYARLEQLVVRLFVAERDLALHLLVDVSASLAAPSVDALACAKQVSAALGFVALSRGDRVSLHTFDHAVRTSSGPFRGRRATGAFLEGLERLTTSGATSMRRSVETFLARRPRAGLVAIVSDLLDEGGIEGPLDRLRAAGHEPALFHVFAPGLPVADSTGDVALVDAESGAVVSVTLDDAVVDAYMRRVARWLASIEAYATKYGLTYARFARAEDVEEQLVRVLAELHR